MLLAAADVGGVAVHRGARWHDIETATAQQVARVLPALLILLAIGLLIGTWMVSGTMPYLVAWGVRLVDPRWLALAAFLSCALMSTVTGTSWGSAGTLGVAMMGTATALGAPLPVVAGAVISGAYFGDKMSPLSDTTIVAAVAAETDVYAHIRAMVQTAGPSFLVAALVFALAGRGSGADVGAGDGPALADELARAFRLHPALLLPPLAVLVAIVRRVPSAVAIALSSLVAAVVALVVQGAAVSTVVDAAVAGVRVDMVMPSGDGAAVSDGFRRLVERGGMRAMTPTLLVVFAAFLLTGARRRAAHSRRCSRACSRRRADP
jgi:NhaC family Na+:H+ antiporter